MDGQRLSQVPGRLGDDLEVFLVPVQHAAFAVGLHGHRYGDLSAKSRVYIERRFLAAADALEEILHVRPFRFLGDRNTDFTVAPFRFVSLIDGAFFRFHRYVIGLALELSMIDHDDGALMPADETGNVLRVCHRGTQYERMLLLEVRHQVECIWNLAAIVENVNAARRHHAIGKLRLRPADVQWRYHVEEQIGRNAARIIPILAEPEKTVRVERAL